MKLLEEGTPADSITVMMQKEVAERICAPAGVKSYGALSVAVQYYCDVTKVADVPKEVFVPRPKVDSAVLRLDVRSGKPVDLIDENMFFVCIKAGFSQRRKTLLNCMLSREIYPGLVRHIKEAVIICIGSGQEAACRVPAVVKEAESVHRADLLCRRVDAVQMADHFLLVRNCDIESAVSARVYESAELTARHFEKSVAVEPELFMRYLQSERFFIYKGLALASCFQEIVETRFVIVSDRGAVFVQPFDQSVDLVGEVVGILEKQLRPHDMPLPV